MGNKLTLTLLHPNTKWIEGLYHWLIFDASELTDVRYLRMAVVMTRSRRDNENDEPSLSAFVHETIN
jgi:hypothetical protein